MAIEKVRLAYKYAVVIVVATVTIFLLTIVLWISAYSKTQEGVQQIKNCQDVVDSLRLRITSLEQNQEVLLDGR